MRGIARPRKYRRVGPLLAGRRHHALGRPRRIDGHDKRPRARRAGAAQEFAHGRRRRGKPFAALCAFARQLGIGVERDKPHVLGPQKPADTCPTRP